MIRLLLAAVDLTRGKVLTALCTVLTRLRLRLRGARVGPGLRVRGWVDLHIDRRSVVEIGRGLRLKSGFAENAVGAGQRLGIWTGKGAVLRIGDNVGVSNSTLVCSRSVTIEDEVFIGGGCAIYDTDFHSVDPEARLKRPDETVRTGPIVLGSRVFVGAHTIILKGVSIGESAVIGAGSVVTKPVPAWETWAGNPARHVGNVRLEPSGTP